MQPWQPRSLPPHLAPDSVHLWRIDLDPAPEVYEPLETFLSAGERERVARYRDPAIGRRFVAGRAALRWLLGAYTGAEPAGLVLAEEPEGRPLLSAPSTPELSFNVTHSGEIALIGFSREARIGVDLERLDRPIDAAQVARSFFAPEERAAWERLPAEERQGAFLRAWVQKEAYLKGLGRGLTRSLGNLQVDFNPGSGGGLLVDAEHPYAAVDWDVRLLDMDAQVAAAVAIESRGRELLGFTLRLM